MSVYTHISLAQAQDFAADYGLEVIELIPIQGGIQNSNYFLRCHDQQQYVLTIFENETAQSAGEIVPVLACLAAHQLPVAAPLLVDTQPIRELQGKPAQIAPRLWGDHPSQVTPAQICAVASAQAKLHLALEDFQLSRSHDRGHRYWTQIGQQLQHSDMSVADQALFDEVYQRFAQMQARHPDRPKGWIHSDLFRDNTLFQGDQLTAVLDFFELNFDEWLFDIAISINDFCSLHPAVSLNRPYAQAYLAAYQQLRPLTADELACLNIYLAMAACRFWILRLFVAALNRKHARAGEQVFVKDPALMRAMLVDRLQHELL
jgi:homoserine kinase type II